MKHLFLFFVLLLGLHSAARAQTTTAPDSVAEQQVIRKVGVEMCKQLEQENAKKPLESLTKDEVQQLFARLMMTNIGNSPELMARLTKDPSNARAVGEQMGRKLGAYLVQECTVSRAMFITMGVQSNQKYQPSSADEEKLVMAIAADICRSTNPRLKQLKTLKPEQRMEEITNSFEGGINGHADEIARLYGPDAINDETRMHELGTKIGYQMAKQCPSIMALMVEGRK